MGSLARGLNCVLRKSGICRRSTRSVLFTPSLSPFAASTTQQLSVYHPQSASVSSSASTFFKDKSLHTTTDGRCSPTAESAQIETEKIERVESVLDRRDAGHVELVWSTGERMQFPYAWLRDSCLCSSCHHPSAGERLYRMENLDLDIQPQTVENDSDAARLTLVWPDGHVSPFPHQWLAEHAFTDARRQQRRLQQRPPKQLWDGAAGAASLLRVDHSQLMSDLHVLHQALHHLHTHGVIVVTNGPAELGVVEKVCKRIGLLKNNHYGPIFTIKSRVNANNLAYTSATLSPHMDLQYYYYSPGLSLFHCISQHSGDGGDTILVDSFYLAEIIRKERPDLFELLCSRAFDFEDVGVEKEHFDSRHHKIQNKRSMFEVDRDGNLVRITFNNQNRSARMDVPLELVKPMLEGLKYFQVLSLREENHTLYKMQPGDTLVIDNIRVMHGRVGFSGSAEGTRVLEGCYTDWDELSCRYQVVSRLLRDRAA